MKYLENLQHTTSYLGHVLHLSTSSDDFQRRFFEEFLEIPRADKNFFDWYHERKEGIKQVLRDKPGLISAYIRKAKTLGDEWIYYLTDISKEERRYILQWISQHPDSPLKCLDMIYPDLSHYLSPYQFSGHEDFTEYFQEYKMQKVKNVLKLEFLETVQRYSSKEKHPYFYLDSRPAILEKIRDDTTNAYWFIDCLGSEYLGFIKKFFSNRNVSVMVHIVSATLPTETEYNTEFRQNYGKYLKSWQKLDETKHNGDKTPLSENKSVPTYIVEELESLKECLEQISADLEDHKKVVIISDHGSSRLCVLYNKREQTDPIRITADNVKVRYCQNPSDDLSSYSGLIRQGEYHVWADYNRFSVQGGPQWEIHGGATLEEVVIPIIELTKLDQTTYRIGCPQNTIKVKPKAKACLEFTVSPTCDSGIKIFIGEIDKEFSCSKNQEEIWMCELPEMIKTDSYTATVRYQGQDIGKFEFSIEKGMKKNNLLGSKK